MSKWTAMPSPNGLLLVRRKHIAAVETRELSDVTQVIVRRADGAEIASCYSSRSEALMLVGKLTDERRSDG